MFYEASLNSQEVQTWGTIRIYEWDGSDYEVTNADDYKGEDNQVNGPTGQHFAMNKKGTIT